MRGNLTVERALKMLPASAFSTISTNFAQLSGHSSTLKGVHYPRERRTPSQPSLSLSAFLKSLWFWATCSVSTRFYHERRSPRIMLFHCTQPQGTSTSWILESSIVYSRNWTQWFLSVQGQVHLSSQGIPELGVIKRRYYLQVPVLPQDKLSQHSSPQDPAYLRLDPPARSCDCSFSVARQK